MSRQEVAAGSRQNNDSLCSATRTAVRSQRGQLRSTTNVLQPCTVQYRPSVGSQVLLLHIKLYRLYIVVPLGPAREQN
jgi:hypothetical protein